MQIDSKLLETMRAATPDQRIGLFAKLSEEETKELRKLYCEECGWKHPEGNRCRCWNDE